MILQKCSLLFFFCLNQAVILFVYATNPDEIIKSKPQQKQQINSLFFSFCNTNDDAFLFIKYF